VSLESNPHPESLGLCIYVAQLLPQAPSSFLVTVYDSQGYGGDILTHLHRGCHPFTREFLDEDTAGLSSNFTLHIVLSLNANKETNSSYVLCEAILIMDNTLICVIRIQLRGATKIIIFDRHFLISIITSKPKSC
jgi:hypothetical protein